MKTINQAMQEEHARIKDIFQIFTDKVRNLGQKEHKSVYRGLIGHFNKFKWNLEKHIFIEEKVVMSAYLANSPEASNTDVEQIMNEHKALLNKVQEIEEDLNAGLKPSIEEFSELMAEHEQNEENYFYPKLDEELDIANKKLIIKRCNEVIIG